MFSGIDTGILQFDHGPLEQEIVPAFFIGDQIKAFKPSDIVKTTVFLADMADFAEMNEAYSQFFVAPFPARSAVAVKTLPKGARVEIECIAARG